jgi:hypothetical protein
MREDMKHRNARHLEARLRRRADYLDWLRQQRLRLATEAMALIEQNVDETNGRLVAIRDELVELTNATLEVVRE